MHGPLTLAAMTESRPNGKKIGVFAPFEWMIAGRYLRAKRQESFISVISLFSLIGIALGVATLIIVMSVMNGFKVELLKSILGLSGHVTIQSQMGSLPNFDRVAERLKAVPGVVRVTPVVDGQAMASQNSFNAGVIVRGIRKTDLAKLTPLAEKLRSGSLAYFDRDDVVIVGAGLAARLGLQVGGDITLIAPKGNITPFGTTPRVKTYHVISNFRIGNTLYDSNSSSCR
jgi:lipoprotein-releasing system permease protein